MTPVDLLTSLRAVGLAVSRHGLDRLRLDPVQAIPPDFEPLIKAMKPALLRLLDQERYGTDPRPDLTDDTDTWTDLLARAFDLDGDRIDGAFAALQIARTWGASLVWSGGKARIEPGEAPQDEYAAIKTSALLPNREAIRGLLAGLVPAKAAQSCALPPLRRHLDHLKEE